MTSKGFDRFGSLFELRSDLGLRTELWWETLRSEFLGSDFGAEDSGLEGERTASMEMESVVRETGKRKEFLYRKDAEF